MPQIIHLEDNENLKPLDAPFIPEAAEILGRIARRVMNEQHSKRNSSKTNRAA